MKNLIIITAIAILAASCNGSGKNNNSNMADSTKTSMQLDSLKYYQDLRDSARIQIDRLKEIIPEKEELKTEWREGVNKLEGQFYNLNEKVKKLETTSSHTWGNLKLQLDSAIASMDTTIQNMKLKLKKK